MKQWKVVISRFNVLHISLVLLGLGLTLGILSANVFRGQYYEQMMAYQNKVFTDITHGDIDYSGLFFYSLSVNMKKLCIFWFLSITILGIPYMAFKIVTFGFSTGFFISAITMNYGFKGLLLILVYPLPHGLIYLPLALVSLYKGYNLCQSINHDKHKFMGTLSQQLKQYILLFCILSMLIILASFLEAYVGSFFLKKTLYLFI